MLTNIIVNGTFDNGSQGWSGNDLETNYTETAYLGNGSSNSVAEMDGVSTQTTVMEQSFVVNAPQSTSLTFDAALRTLSNPSAGSEGFTVEILDSNGAVVATQTVLPTANVLQGYTVPVTFPSAGSYTLRLTELGPNDSLGAIVDNFELLVCFAGETLISTAQGLRQARDLQPGDLVTTAQGLQPITWVGQRHVSLAMMQADPALRPLRIRAGALGQGLPRRDLRVSRQHRMLVSSVVAARMFGTPDVLVAAAQLDALPGVAVESADQPIDYVHFLFDRHQIVLAEGAPAESLLLAPRALASLSPQSRAEVEALNPEVLTPGHLPRPAALTPERKDGKTLVQRLVKNRKPALGQVGFYTTDPALVA